MIKNITCVVLLFISAEQAFSSQLCAPTILSQAEAKQLILKVPEALAAITLGGKLSTAVWKRPGVNDVYAFELRSTVSLPTAPIDNGLIGYYSVSKKTGRVLDVAFEEVAGKKLEELQEKLRIKHCVGRSLVQEERDEDQ